MKKITIQIVTIPRRLISKEGVTLIEGIGFMVFLYVTVTLLFAWLCPQAFVNR
jgi:hypothetical protein